MKRLSKLFTNGPLLIIIAASLWALDGVVRRSLYSLPPITIVFYEHLIGLLIILPFFLPKMRSEKATKQTYGVLFLIALFSGLLGTLWFTQALLEVHYISFSVVFLLQKLQPIFAIAAGAILLKEKITRRYLLWAVVALTAAYFVTFKDGYVNLATGGGTIMAALYAFGAAVVWGSSTALSRMVLLKHSDTFVTGYRFLMTMVLAFVAIFLFGGTISSPVPDMSQLLRFIFIALSTGLVALLIYYKGLAKTQVKVATILELTFPVLAILIDALLYKNLLAPTQFLAAGVLLFSIFQISRLNKEKK